MKKNLRLAVSGTYSTGKTTTTEALSIATGVPRTHARTAREILRDISPGKALEDLSAGELIQMGLRRLEERIHHEAEIHGAYISDGSVIHEWVYGEVRMRQGINPNATIFHKLLTEVAGWRVKKFYQQYMNAYGAIVKDRARRTYDAYIHLPVEFEMHKDGHRPVSEKFRNGSDQLLLSSIKDIGIPCHVIGGSIEERLEKIIDVMEMPTVVPIKEAAEIAKQRVALYHEELEQEAQRVQKLRDNNWIKKLKYSFRY